MLLVVGVILNFIGGIMALVRYFSSLRTQESHFFISSPITDYKKNNFELGVGIVAILTGSAMLADIIHNFVSQNN